MLRLAAFSVQLVMAAWLLAGAARGAEAIPHAQDRLPGPPLSPAEALLKMRVPEGFHVELVASEPDIVNPVAMTFDERGRIWITESLEYPRQGAGPGRDRIKVLEDTDGDGKADAFSIFADGFNIPSGIAIGYGGVWVANAPDILFLEDTDGDGKADRREVIVTGFGRDDTHELPNSLTWGPDGWLYGLNGVFNQSRVSQRGKTHAFTCALFRIHPRSHEFQLFAQGTSNPWGIAWDTAGSAFVSACVIDHLWHLAESGYYMRQGGPYPPFTSPMRSIVGHKHQKAAYCGIHFFDSDAYPEQYRERLYMGNIHGNAINVDVLARAGSTYVGTAAPDFLNANDAWFMPVVQKTGPDGCLYVLDWYDRYHCYQDARRDPEGIDRLKGRLYRIRYQDSPRASKFDLAAETDRDLIDRLNSPNVYFRDIAQRILSERNDPETRFQLERLVAEGNTPRKSRLHALWALVGGGALSVELHQRLLADDDATFRAWGVRAAGNMGNVDSVVRDRVQTLANDPAAEVRLQVATAATKLAEVEPLPLLLEVLRISAGDKLIEHIVWQNLHPLLEDQGERFLHLVAAADDSQQQAVARLMPRIIDRLLAGGNPTTIGALIGYLNEHADLAAGGMQKCLRALAVRLENREFPPERAAELQTRLAGIVDKLLAGPPEDPLFADAAILATTWKLPSALTATRKIFAAEDRPTELRERALRALVAATDTTLEASISQLLAGEKSPSNELQVAAIRYLSELDASWVPHVVLQNYPHFQPQVQAAAVELLTKRGIWTEQLLEAIGRGEIPSTALNANQVRSLLVKADAALAAKIKKHWGVIRQERDPKREEVVAQMRSFLRRTPGDAV
ncbi:MAG TPA: PVC-type heme-binding CxxCH protein, partial [Pirellulales bacterium]|nr:PVC-type heme-binding CxxCH protein [Pirellulales bacterium]